MMGCDPLMENPKVPLSLIRRTVRGGLQDFPPLNEGSGPREANRSSTSFELNSGTLAEKLMSDATGITHKQS